MSNGGTPLLAITHNTIFNPVSQTDAVALFEDFSAQANRTVTNNLLAGGAYSIYGGATKTEPTSNIVITGNRFATNYYPNARAFRPVAYLDSTGQRNNWSSNTWDTPDHT